MAWRKLFHAARVTSNFLFGANLYNRSRSARAVYDAAQAVHMRVNPQHRRWRQYLADNPLAPWIVPDAVPFFESLLVPGMRAFEWGAGRSTVWLAMHGVEIVSVELNPTWAQWVGQALAERNLSKLVDLRVTHESGDAYANIILSCEELFDLVIVDGDSRVECLAALSQAVKPGGVVIVDNADRADLVPALSTWSDLLLQSFDNGISRTNFYSVRRD
jgi:predicted O-methyltransferase YrrM